MPGARDNPSQLGALLSNIGIAELELGMLASARSRFEDVLALRRGPNESPAAVAEVIGHLALVDLAERRWDDAAARFEASIRGYEAQAPDLPSMSHPLVGLGQLAIARGRPAEAIAPLQRALALREAGGFADDEVAEVRELLTSARLAAGG